MDEGRIKLKMDLFEKNFRRIVEPYLKELGFNKVTLKNCMHPQFLFNKERLWFSLSWDFRDSYLDVNLGHLFWFRDVMERVEVIGDYSNYESQITPSAIGQIGSDQKVFKIIVQSLKNAIIKYENNYDEIFQNFRISRSQRSGINIDQYIGKEVSINDLKDFFA